MLTLSWSCLGALQWTCGMCNPCVCVCVCKWHYVSGLHLVEVITGKKKKKLVAYHPVWYGCCVGWTFYITLQLLSFLFCDISVWAMYHPLEIKDKDVWLTLSSCLGVTYGPSKSWTVLLDHNCVTGYYGKIRFCFMLKFFFFYGTSEEHIPFWSVPTGHVTVTMISPLWDERITRLNLERKKSWNSGVGSAPPP